MPGRPCGPPAAGVAPAMPGGLRCRFARADESSAAVVSRGSTVFFLCTTGHGTGEKPGQYISVLWDYSIESQLLPFHLQRFSEKST